MVLADGISWTCIGSLYVGFASLQGLLARSSRPHARPALHPAAAVAFTAAVLIPASILVLSMPGLTLPPRLGILALGMGSALAAYLQPRKLPNWLWSSSFARIHLAATMALAALWGLLLTPRTTPSNLIGVASAVACLCAALPASRQDQAARVFEVE